MQQQNAIETIKISGLRWVRDKFHNLDAQHPQNREVVSQILDVCGCGGRVSVVDQLFCELYCSHSLINIDQSSSEKL